MVVVFIAVVIGEISIAIDMLLSLDWNILRVKSKLIEGVFDKTQKQAMINKVTNAMVEVEGEAMRGVTWVRLYEVASGEWAIGGKALSAADVKAMQARSQ